MSSGTKYERKCGDTRRDATNVAANRSQIAPNWDYCDLIGSSGIQFHASSESVAEECEVTGTKEQKD